MVDEANIEAHAFYREVCRDPRYTGAFVERVPPWSSATRTTPASSSGRSATRAATGRTMTRPRATSRGRSLRPLHYEGAISRGDSSSWAGRHRATDVVCPMYPQIKDIVAWAKTSRTGGR